MNAMVMIFAVMVAGFAFNAYKKFGSNNAMADDACWMKDNADLRLVVITK